MRKIITATAVLALAGCASIDTPLDDDYQVGGLTGSILEMQAEYCATADPRQRAFRLAALRAAGVPIPPSGACADIISLVPEVDIDTTETEADRERFEGMTDADADTSPAADDTAAD